jgi:nucleoside-diphosphate-sugar epimerase
MSRFVGLPVRVLQQSCVGLPKASGEQETACNPTLPYERGKLESEHFLREPAKRNKFKVVALRFPQICGLAYTAFMQIVRLIRKGAFPVVRGRIGSLPLIHLRDCVGATYAVIRNASRIQENFEVYLVPVERLAACSIRSRCRYQAALRRTPSRRSTCGL